MQENRNKLIIIAVVVVLLVVLLILISFMNKKYTVTFDSDGGTAVEKQTVNRNRIVIQPQDPKKEGYAFIGWYYENNMDKKYDFTDKVQGDLKLKAKWEVSEEVPNTVTAIEIIADKNEILIDEELTLTLKITPEDINMEELEIIWTSSDEKIATISKEGKIKALSAGNVTMKVKINDIEATFELNVKEPEEEEPETPETNPSTTSTPSSSGSSGYTGPTNPQEPTNPEQPENPQEPNTPDQPTNPQEPQEPDNPVNPGESENPEEPENPQDPNTPGESDGPQEPGNSTESDTPNKQVI